MLVSLTGVPRISGHSTSIGESCQKKDFNFLPPPRAILEITKFAARVVPLKALEWRSW